MGEVLNYQISSGDVVNWKGLAVAGCLVEF